MLGDQGKLMTKPEIADLLGVSIEDIYRWAQSPAFAEWLDVCPTQEGKAHDENDVLIFTFISEINRQIKDNAPFIQRVHLIERGLWSFDRAVSIRQKRSMEKSRPEVARWQIVDTAGVCLRYDYEWLEPLESFVDSIADFGCWASSTDTTCSEPYALLWTLEATRVVVIDKEPEYIRNAQVWLDTTRKKEPYFKDYNLEFHVGDLTERIDALNDGDFDLSYCRNVLYNMEHNLEELQSSINEMARVTKPGGWVVAVEPKIGTEFESVPLELSGGKVSIPVRMSDPIDISPFFEIAGLNRDSLNDAPDGAYCYRKPLVVAPGVTRH